MYQIIKGSSIEEINEALAESDNIEWVGEIKPFNYINYYDNGAICEQWLEFYITVKYKYE
jgi:hypothetical protein